MSDDFDALFDFDGNGKLDAFEKEERSLFIFGDGSMSEPGGVARPKDESLYGDDAEEYDIDDDCDEDDLEYDDNEDDLDLYDDEEYDIDFEDDDEDY